MAVRCLSGSYHICWVAAVRKINPALHVGLHFFYQFKPDFVMCEYHKLVNLDVSSFRIFLRRGVLFVTELNTVITLQTLDQCLRQRRIS